MKKFNQFIKNESQLEFRIHLTKDIIHELMKLLAVELIDKRKFSLQDYNQLISLDQISFIGMQAMGIDAPTDFKSIGTYFMDFVSGNLPATELNELQLNNVYWALEILRTSERKVFHTIMYMYVSKEDGIDIYEILGSKIEFYTKLGYAIMDCKDELVDDYKMYKSIMESMGVNPEDSLDPGSNNQVDKDINHMENLLRGYSEEDSNEGDIDEIE